MSTIGVAAKVLSLSSVAEICWVVMRWRFGHQRNAFMIIAEAFRNRGYIRPLILRDKLVWQVGLFCVTCCLMFFFFFFSRGQIMEKDPFYFENPSVLQVSDPSPACFKWPQSHLFEPELVCLISRAFYSLLFKSCMWKSYLLFWRPRWLTGFWQICKFAHQSSSQSLVYLLCELLYSMYFILLFLL